MIGLLIQDNAYEQDIRELLMSFYPGETYAHEIKDGVEFLCADPSHTKGRGRLRCLGGGCGRTGMECRDCPLGTDKRGRGRRLQSLIFQCRKDWRTFTLRHPPEDIRIFPTTARRKMW